MCKVHWRWIDDRLSGMQPHDHDLGSNRGLAFAASYFVMTVGPIGLRPVSPVPAQTERFTAFLIVGGLLGVGYPKKLALMVAVVVVSAGLFELAQHLVPIVTVCSLTSWPKLQAGSSGCW
jgi:hypothetical protein